MNIEDTITPTSADIDFLTQKINQETPEFGAAYPFKTELVIFKANWEKISATSQLQQMIIGCCDLRKN